MRLPEPSSSRESRASRFMAPSAPDPEALRRSFGVTPADRGTPPAPPGCYFIGTSCAGFVQTCHYRCGEGKCVSQGCGWCVGYWQAPPCI